jgi:thiol-disulfide isomerase/thioredoxin
MIKKRGLKIKKIYIKDIFKEIVIFLALIFVISLVINYFRAPKIDSRYLSYIKGKTIDGVEVEKFKREFPLVIHFWGSWCPICKQEASNIDRVAKDYNLLSIAVDSGSDEELKRWMKERGLSYPVLNDKSGELAKRFKIKLFPTTIIFDKNGKIKFIESGYTTTLGLIGRIKLAK